MNDTTKALILLIFILLLCVMSVQSTTMTLHITEDSKYSSLVQEFKHDMELEAKVFVFNTNWYDEITNTSMVDKKYTVKKFIETEWLRDGFVSGYIAVHIIDNNIDSTSSNKDIMPKKSIWRYTKFFVYDYLNKTLIQKEPGILDFSNFTSNPGKTYIVKMDESMYAKFMRFLR